MRMMTPINIRLDENDLHNVLKQYIDHPDMIKIIIDIACSSHLGVEWIFKIHLGKTYPVVPEIGTRGYANVTHLSSWTGNVDKYVNSEFNQHGFIPVVVESFQGLHNYYPLRVKAPELKEGFIQGDNVFALDVENFITDDEFDAYQPYVAKSGDDLLP